MKSYCGLNQCKVLMEFLPLESADMFYACYSGVVTGIVKYSEEPMVGKPICNPKTAIPCWSLAALLSILSFPALRYEIEDGEGGWIVGCEKNGKKYLSYYRDNPVDTCYEMIVKLHEKSLL